VYVWIICCSYNAQYHILSIATVDLSWMQKRASYTGDGCRICRFQNNFEQEKNNNYRMLKKTILKFVGARKVQQICFNSMLMHHEITYARAFQTLFRYGTQ